MSTDLDLHAAAQAGDLPTVIKLLTQGANINATDIFGITPLHLAAMYGHAPVVAYLLNKGAKVNILAYEKPEYGSLSYFTPLDLAVLYSPNTETIALLLEHGARPDHWGVLMDKLMSAALTAGKYNDYAAFDLALSKFEVLAENSPHGLLMEEGFGIEETPVVMYLQNYAAQMTDITCYDRTMAAAQNILACDKYGLMQNNNIAKILLHVFPSDHTYTFKIGPYETTIEAEGHFSLYTTTFAAESLATFTQTLSEDPFKQNIFAQVTETFETAATTMQQAGLYATSETLYQEYVSGKTILLPTGWDGHAIDVILDKDLNLILFANGGDQYSALNPGLMAYHPQVNIEVNDIYNMLNNTDIMDIEFKYYYDLGLTFCPEYSFVTPGQEYGNCAWNSQLIAEQALIFLELKKVFPIGDDALTLATTWFAELENFQQMSILETYAENPTLFDAKTDQPLKIDEILGNDLGFQIESHSMPSIILHPILPTHDETHLTIL